VSTLNSLDGRVKANAAIVPAGAGGAVSVFVTDPSDVVLDINGYFVPVSGANGLSFYPVTPCRIADTRNATGPFGAPSISAGGTRTFLPDQSTCNLPPTAQAYSLNFTVVPKTSLSFLTVWPFGQNQPLVSTLNSPTGAIVANAAIVSAGTNFGINAYATDTTDVIVDVNGYFAPPGALGALSFYTVSPCRMLDTRSAPGVLGGPVISANQTRTYPLLSSACGISGNAKAYSLNATVVPWGSLGYLSLWPAEQPQPLVSTLNAIDGAITGNAAIVPAGAGGTINAFVTSNTDLILDIAGYFAP
jgi:prefoldin subunit 5